MIHFFAQQQLHLMITAPQSQLRMSGTSSFLNFCRGYVPRNQRQVRSHSLWRVLKVHAAMALVVCKLMGGLARVPNNVQSAIVSWCGACTNLRRCWGVHTLQMAVSICTAAGTSMHTAIAAGKGWDREPHAAACPLETIPGALCRPAAGKPSQRETWQSVATMITTEAPFATHGFVHSGKDQVNMEGLDNAWEAVAHRVLHERQIWAAAKLQSQGPKNVHARRKGCNLQAADAMWFDASMPMLQQYPLRACWGRYCS
jgi:hypothetical protein